MNVHRLLVRDERESILIYRMQGLNFSQITKLLQRHPSCISREWKRVLEIDHNLINTVKHLFLDYQLSPEEIEGSYQEKSVGNRSCGKNVRTLDEAYSNS